MGYARQEKRFHDGEAVSAKIVANLIQAAGADEFITFNIHEKCVLDFLIFQLQIFLLWVQ